MNKILTDRISLSKNTIDVSQIKENDHKSGLWAKTRIIGGYGLHKNSLGISELDEVVFDKTNMVPLGGVQFAMEMIYGVAGPIAIPRLDAEPYNIGAVGSTVAPSGGMPHPYGQKVCLFGVGYGGTEENNLTVIEVKYNDYEVASMVPFRYTADPLSEADKLKYYGKKAESGSNIVSYYLKRFDEDPIIHHLRKNGVEGEDGSEITSREEAYNTPIGEGIETFTESLLTISKKDVREWFDSIGKIEETRINSIGLFSAVYDAELKDYANITLFSKLNIPTEPLSLTKDMNIIYRVYGS